MTQPSVYTQCAFSDFAFGSLQRRMSLKRVTNQKRHTEYLNK